MKLTPLALTAAAIITIAAALLTPGVSAQEATPPVLLCHEPGLSGGLIPRTVNGITVELPEGASYNWSITPPGGEQATFSVCIVGTSARVFIQVTDCREHHRINPGNDAELDNRLDAIVDSCRVPPPGSDRSNICLGTPRPGGQQIELANGILITPPGGASYIIGVQPPNAIAYAICYDQSGLYVVLSQRDCSEVRRYNPGMNPGADYYFDTIVDSCVKLVLPTIPPEELVPIEDPFESTTNRITPPDTGTAGLKQQPPSKEAGPR